MKDKWIDTKFNPKEKYCLSVAFDNENVSLEAAKISKYSLRIVADIQILIKVHDDEMPSLVED